MALQPTPPNTHQPRFLTFGGPGWQLKVTPKGHINAYVWGRSSCYYGPYRELPGNSRNGFRAWQDLTRCVRVTEPKLCRLWFLFSSLKLVHGVQLCRGNMPVRSSHERPRRKLRKSHCAAFNNAIIVTRGWVTIIFDVLYWNYSRTFSWFADGKRVYLLYFSVYTLWNKYLCLITTRTLK